MLFIDNILNDTSDADVAFRSGNGKAFVKAYAGGGMVANTPYAIQFSASLYNATVLAASIWGMVGVPERVCASGCTGWVQVRGNVEGVQASVAESTGSVGHIIQWHAGTICASSSTHIGSPYTGDVGMLTQEAEASTTLNIWLNGIYVTPLAAG